MSDPRNSPGLFSAVAGPLGEEHAKYQNLPAGERNVVRARFGGFLLGLAGYTAVKLGPYASYYSQEWKLGWLACAGLGLFLLVFGVKGARGPREPVTAFFALALPIGGGIALSNWLPGLLENFYVQAFAVGVVASCAVQFFLAIRGNDGNAQKIVTQQIAQQEVAWRGVKRR
jgi:hypothetical protein